MPESFTRTASWNETGDLLGDLRAAAERYREMPVSERYAPSRIAEPTITPRAVLDAVAAMSPAEKADLSFLLSAPEISSPFLWMPRPTGGFAPPLYPRP